MSTKLFMATLATSLLILSGCSQKKEVNPMQEKVDQFALVDLTTDLSHLGANDKAMLLKLIEVSEIMEELFGKMPFLVIKQHFWNHYQMMQHVNLPK